MGKKEEKCYVYNIFTTNSKGKVEIGCYKWVKKYFKLWIQIRTNNNLPPPNLL